MKKGGATLAPPDQPKTLEEIPMDACEVKLTVSRAGPKLEQKAGQVVEVSLLEAGRLLRNGACERPDAKTLKAIAAAEAEAAKEAAAAAEPPAETAAQAASQPE